MGESRQEGMISVQLWSMLLVTTSAGAPGWMLSVLLWLQLWLWWTAPSLLVASWSGARLAGRAVTALRGSPQTEDAASWWIYVPSFGRKNLRGILRSASESPGDWASESTAITSSIMCLFWLFVHLWLTLSTPPLLLPKITFQTSSLHPSLCFRLCF